jgi:hypothetical protein
MIGGPLPVYSLRPALTGEAEAFLRALMSRPAAPSGYVPESHGWLSAYWCTRCRACGAGVVIGRPCHGCGGPR